MLDAKHVIENLDEVIKVLNTRNGDFSFLEELKTLEKRRKEIILEVEEYKRKRNESSKLIGQLKKEKKDTTQIMKEVGSYGDKIKDLDDELTQVTTTIRDILLKTPNLLDSEVPAGKDEEDNKEVYTHGEIPTYNFEVKDHSDLAVNLDIIDFQRGVKVAKSRFVAYKGLGARLERALVNFMLDTHTTTGYTEVYVPQLVNSDCMIGTGQLPKFKDDAFKVEGSDLYLIPTAEVPVTNLHREEILDVKTLPIKYCSFSSCFRQEAGSAGRDTKGIIRVHQFQKVELVKFTMPEDSDKELEGLCNDAESILKALELPYRKVLLCSGDTGFSSAKTYDLEVYLPSFKTYREISSCSNFKDYQARRANIKFKRSKDSKPEFAHTINGSGLAVGRTVAAILENYQNEDGSITIPKALVPYMGTDKITKG